MKQAALTNRMEVVTAVWLQMNAFGHRDVISFNRHKMPQD